MFLSAKNPEPASPGLARTARWLQRHAVQWGERMCIVFEATIQRPIQLMHMLVYTPIDQQVVFDVFAMPNLSSDFTYKAASIKKKSPTRE